MCAKKSQKPKKSNMICGVCGDTAIARNFGAIACEPCKAFFRRYAFKQRWLICATYGKCNITVNTRSYCKKCRIEKCFSIGMRKEIIRTEEERQSKRLLIEENRLKKQKLNECSDSVDSTFNSYPGYL
ncbi:unnamed protein product [Oppiella nova]|uniref:Nuclear receptor domain-containing protein n=1 Tax=Oppiella nova TaxID=334625 RepID=A0A7R9QDV7_9ACAR|nr:unnamed protein product [Oppiella nova]CAG2163356.1 unnamed protein product [Oppiella nova]